MTRTAGKIFVMQNEDTLVELTQREYEVEKLLEGLLERHPALLGGDQIDSELPRQFLLVDPQMGVPEYVEGVDRWALDLLYLDQSAVPTFVEVKKGSNLELRRKVVAQMLDYVANAVVNWPNGHMRVKYQETCAERLQDPFDQLISTFGAEIDAEDFWELAEQNLRLGRVRLLFVADEVPASLLRIVEFLNTQMERVEVLAVEVRQFVGLSSGQELKTLVPRVLGQSVSAKEKKDAKSSGKIALPIVSVEEFPFLYDDTELSNIANAILTSATDTGWNLKATSTVAARKVYLEHPSHKDHFLWLDRTDEGGGLWIGFVHKVDGGLETGIEPIQRSILESVVPDHSSQVKKRVVENRNGVWINLEILKSPDSLERMKSFIGTYFDSLASETGLIG